MDSGEQSQGGTHLQYPACTGLPCQYHSLNHHRRYIILAMDGGVKKQRILYKKICILKQDDGEYRGNTAGIQTSASQNRNLNGTGCVRLWATLDS